MVSTIAKVFLVESHRQPHSNLKECDICEIKAEEKATPTQEYF